MRIELENNLKVLIADEGKHIRGIDDIYIPAHYDEEGNYIEEYIPTYFVRAYVPNKVTEENIYEKYVEELIGG